MTQSKAILDIWALEIQGNSTRKLSWTSGV